MDEKLLIYAIRLILRAAVKCVKQLEISDALTREILAFN
jgi:hypothetical protein